MGDERIIGRLEFEVEELERKMERLDAAIYNPLVNITPTHKNIMADQHEIMSDYIDVLQRRIRDLEDGGIGG